MKNTIIALLALIMALTFAACSSSGTQETKVLGIVIPNATHDFMAESIRHAEAGAKEMAQTFGVEYRLLISESSAEQAQQIDTLINEKVDALVLWPHNGEELKDSTERIGAAGIPLVVYDRLIPDFTPTAWVMGDNEGLGRLAGEYFSRFFADELANGEVYYLEFKGDTSTVPKQRSGGFHERLHNSFKRVGEPFITYYQRQTAMEQMAEFLTSNPDAEKVQAIFTHDDEVALGILDAIKNHGDALNIRLISGVSGDRNYLDTFAPVLGQFGIAQVTYEYSPSMVRNAVEAGMRLLAGEDLSGLILVPTFEVDNQNEAEYRSSEVYITRYSQ